MEPEDAASFMLQEGSVRFLVTEEVNQEDLSALKTSLQDIEGVIAKLSPLGAKLPNSLSKFLEKAASATKTGQNFASALNLQDADGVMGTIKQFFGGKVDLSQALKAVAKIYSQASTAATTITKAAELIGGELEGKIGKESKDKPLKDAAEEAGMDPDLMKQAFTKAFKSARPGMLSRMTDFFKNAGAELKGAEIPEFDAGAFAEEAAAALSLNDLVNLGAVSDEIDEPPKEDLEDIAEAEPGEVKTGDEAGGGGEEGDPSKAVKRKDFDLAAFIKEKYPELFKAMTAAGEEGEDKALDQEVDIEDGDISPEDAVAALEDEFKGEEGDDGDAELPPEEELSKEENAEAEEMADEAGLGSLPFGKMELTSLLKSFPDITGKGNKATKSRRAFRIAMNKAAGSPIFEESFDRSPKQAEVLVEHLFRKEEDPVVSRWMRLAGL